MQDQPASLKREYTQILLSAAITGPITWPIAAELIARQQGIKSYSFLSSLRSDGVRRTFSGVGPYASYKLFGITAQRGVQAPVLSHLDEGTTMHKSLQYIIAGICSGLVGGLLVTPVEQFKISFANKHFSSYREMKAFFLSSAAGIRTLFVGTRATVFRNVIFDSVNSVLYHSAVNSEYIDRRNAGHLGAINCVTGVVTAVIDYPLDVIKTRIQSEAVEVHKRRVSPFSANVSISTFSTSPLKAGAALLKSEGWRSLYAGLEHKVSLYAAVWLVYGLTYGAIGDILSHKLL